jgi:predicted ribosomally synthesized peptide with SipW-like signal peptide
MDKKILVSVMVIGLVAALAGAGLYAYFSDTETSSNNTFTAGTLDLTVNGPGFSAPITLSNMKPGDDNGYYKWVLKNAGTLPGKISVTFSEIINSENGQTEPETIAENSKYVNHRGELVTAGDPTNGELGQYLKPGIHPDDIPDDVKPYVKIIERNDEEGWWIGEVSAEVDTGGTIGWGPKGSSVPSNLYSQWQTGPRHPWGTPGLNCLGGKTYGTLGYLPGDILAPGQEVAFFFRVVLDSNLQIWNGCNWVEVDDNIIQSDSVTFTITFTLEQIPP